VIKGFYNKQERNLYPLQKHLKKLKVIVYANKNVTTTIDSKSILKHQQIRALR